MLFLYTWKDKSRKDKIKDVAQMMLFVVIVIFVIALWQAAVKKTNENIAKLDL